jgi:hypothetical protein
MNTIEYWDRLIQSKLKESWELHPDTISLMDITKDKVEHILSYFNEIIIWWLKKKTRKLRGKILKAAENQISFNRLNEQFAHWLDNWELIHTNWKVEYATVKI